MSYYEISSNNKQMPVSVRGNQVDTQTGTALFVLRKPSLQQATVDDTTVLSKSGGFKWD